MSQSRVKTILSYFNLRKPNPITSLMTKLVGEINSPESLDKKAIAIGRLKKIVDEQRRDAYFWQFFYKSRLSSLSKYLDVKIEELKNERIEEKKEQRIQSEAKYNAATEGLVQGPRTKEDSTYAFEEVVRILLSSPKDARVSYNEEDELLIKIGNNTSYNITQILKSEPDFEQLQFTNEELDSYVNFLKDEADTKPRLTSEFTTQEQYATLDPNNVNSHLHYAEKLAITLYSYMGNAKVTFTEMQSFLRGYAKKSGRGLDLLTIKELLFSIAIASHGLSKPLNTNLDPQQSMDLAVVEYQTLTRGEDSDYDSQLNKDRRDDVEHERVSTASGFVSTSTEEKVAKHFGSTTTLSFLNPKNKSAMGRDIQTLSNSSGEKEVLFVPGTQYKVTDYTEKTKKGEIYSEITAVPVRPLTKTHTYTENDYNKRLRQISQSLATLEAKLKDPLDEKDIKLYKNRIQSMQLNLTVMKQYKNTENKVTGIEGTKMQETWNLMNDKCKELLQKLDKLSPSLSASQSLRG